jgi:hypothetical protein
MFSAGYKTVLGSLGGSLPSQFPYLTLFLQPFTEAHVLYLHQPRWGNAEVTTIVYVI